MLLRLFSIKHNAIINPHWVSPLDLLLMQSSIGTGGGFTISNSKACLLTFHFHN